MKGIRLVLLALLLLNVCFAQTTLFSENFETGGSSFTLNTTDLGGTNSPNFWIVNNAYTGGNGSLVCMGFPFTYTIANTPTQTFHPNPTSYYLHTMSIYGQADNIFCSSFAAADGFCIFNSTNFCKQNSGISTLGYQNVSLKFYWVCSGGPNIYGQVYYSTNGGSSWTQCTTPISQYQNTSSWALQTISLPAFDNVADLRFAFRFVNNQSNSAADPGFSIDDLQVVGTAISSTTISTNALASSSFCAGDTIAVPYTISGSYNPGNVFTAQLSNGSGSFASPTAIGSVTSTTAGTITAILPGNTPLGLGYRIRVVASNPSTTGTDNGSNISIDPLPVAGTATVSGPGTICQGSVVQVNLAGSTGFIVWESSPNGTNWTSTGQTGGSTSFALSNTTYLRAAVSNGCGLAYSNTVMVTVTPSNVGYAMAVLSHDSLCDGDTTTVQVQYHGTAPTWYTSTNGGSSWNLSANTHPTTYHTPPLSASNDNRVRVIVDNGACGYDTIEVAIQVESILGAFSYTQNGNTFNFTDNSTNAVSWAWDFGDGNTSTLQNPVHTYATGGTYTVQLTVTSPFGCLFTFTQTLNVAVGLSPAVHMPVSVWPVPFSTTLRIQGQAEAAGWAEFGLADLQGRKLWSSKEWVSGGQWELQFKDGIEHLAAGTYVVSIRIDGRVWSMQAVKL